MHESFWEKLKKPIMAMAPMANVTDAAFRQMFVENGSPDIFWTEFVSVEGLLSKGKDRLLVDFWYSEEEHPIVAQIFGSKPEQFERVAMMIKKLGFDGIDINMGCPAQDIEKSGAGAALIKNPRLTKDIIKATKHGAGGLPVSIKTRIGYSKEETKEWLPVLLEEDLAALTIHLRTRDEMSDVPAHWELAPEIVAIRNQYAPQTLLLGNGDVNTVDEARSKTKESGFDGVMMGRGMFGNPWLFSEHIPSLDERFKVMIKHTELFEEKFRNGKNLKNFDVMKKHFKAYVNGFEGARELRALLMETTNAIEVKKIAEEFLKNNH